MPIEEGRIDVYREVRLSNTRTVFKNTFVLFIAQIAAMVISFFCLMYMGRYLGPKNFGVITLAIAFSNFFVGFGDLGLTTVLTRDISRDFDKAITYMSNAATIKLIMMICIFGLIILTAFLTGYTAEVIHAIILIALSAVLMNFAQIYFSLFQAVEKMEFQGLIQIPVILSALLSGRILHRKCSFRLFNNLRVERDIWIYLLKESIPFGLSAIFVGVYMWFDTMLLSFIKGEQSVGYYNAANKIVMVFNVIPLSIVGAIFPLMARLHSENSDYLKSSFNRAFKYMVIAGLPIATGITLLADRIITVVFGTNYQASVLPLQILIWPEFFIFCSLVSVVLLNSIGKQFMVTIQCIGAACVSLIINLSLIPLYDYIGTCIANFATYLLSFLFLIIICEKSGFNLLNKSNLLLVLKVCAALFIMGLYVTYFSVLNIMLLISTSALVYFIILILVKGIDKSDIELVKGLFRMESHD
ncbi:MAG: flippase [Chloroflexi bacterium]|nr:flippase [Chloroflexota bacterium]